MRNNKKMTKKKLSNVWISVMSNLEMIRQYAGNDSVDLSDVTENSSIPEACVVDGIPNGRIGFPELLPRILEDFLE